MSEKSIEALSRSQWTQLDDGPLLKQCEVDTYRASGPGGQKRNKTSSAVRIRHQPSGLIVIAEESRSQHENRERALKRLRQAFFLEIREEVGDLSLLAEVSDGSGHFHLSRKNVQFWPVAGLVLDCLQATDARLADAAKLLGTSTGNLVDFLQTDVKLWQQANHLRARFGQKPLKSD